MIKIDYNNSMAKKIISIEKIAKLKNKKEIILVGGCFDIIHIGHIIFLEKAKAQNGLLVVLLESDEFIKKNKKRQPFHNQKERAAILSNLSIVDHIIPINLLNGFFGYLNIIKKIKPSVIAITEDDPQLANKKKQALEIGAKLKIVTPLIKNQSTTRILNRIGF